MRQLFPEAQTWDDVRICVMRYLLFYLSRSAHPLLLEKCKITVESYKRKISGLLHMKLPPPNTWTFGGLKRNKETGLFDDKQLADILKDAMEVPAGAFGARRTPHVMRIIEMMSIQQNRDWGTCSLNEFRKVHIHIQFSMMPEKRRTQTLIGLAVGWDDDSSWV